MDQANKDRIDQLAGEFYQEFFRPDENPDVVIVDHSMINGRNEEIFQCIKHGYVKEIFGLDAPDRQCHFNNKSAPKFLRPGEDCKARIKITIPNDQDSYDIEYIHLIYAPSVTVLEHAHSNYYRSFDFACSALILEIEEESRVKRLFKEFIFHHEIGHALYEKRPPEPRYTYNESTDSYNFEENVADSYAALKMLQKYPHDIKLIEAVLLWRITASMTLRDSDHNSIMSLNSIVLDHKKGELENTAAPKKIINHAVHIAEINTLSSKHLDLFKKYNHLFLHYEVTRGLKRFEYTETTPANLQLKLNLKTIEKRLTPKDGKVVASLLSSYQNIVNRYAEKHALPSIRKHVRKSYASVGAM